MTKYTLHKLRYAFSLGCTDREACVFAGISRMTMYRYQHWNPDFCDQKQGWQDLIVIYSRRVIAEAIKEGNVKLAWAYLHAKRAFNRENDWTLQPNIIDNSSVAHGAVGVPGTLLVHN